MVYTRMEPIGSAVPLSVEHMIAIDTEDDTKGNMIIACVYGTYLKRKHRGKEVIKVKQTFYNRKDLTDFLLGLVTEGQNFVPCYIVGFNLDYDMAYFDEVVDYSTVLYSGTRFITGELVNGIPLIDIFNHGGGKNLDSWITDLKMNEKGIFKTEWTPDLTLAELVDHCENDVRAHWELAEFFRQTYRNIGVAFKSTTSATALNLFRRKFLTDKWGRESDKFNAYERLAYYGGRTEIFSRGFQNIVSYDINSAYVSVMADGWYPKPDTAQMYHTQKGFRHYYNDKEHLMIVHCTVLAPKSRVMVLPYRDAETGKLLFPWGKFDGWWCSPELHKAEEYGYKILKVHDYIIYRTKKKYFEGYANYTWDQRHKAEKDGNDGMKNVWKLFGNGLYGKMAQLNPIGGGFSPVLRIYKEGSQPITYIAKNGTTWYMDANPDKEEATNSFPCVSAFITCYTRLKLLEYLKRHEATIVYCDTDSVKFPVDDTPEISSKDLGGVKKECSEDPEKNQCGWFCFLKPKLYGRVPESFKILPADYDFIKPLPDTERLEISDSDQKWKIKGVGKFDWCYFDMATMTFAAQFKKPHRFKESIRRKLTRNEWETISKTLTILDDKRKWLGTDSEPLKVMDVKNDTA